MKRLASGIKKRCSDGGGKVVISVDIRIFALLILM